MQCSIGPQMAQHCRRPDLQIEKTERPLKNMVYETLHVSVLQYLEIHTNKMSHSFWNIPNLPLKTFLTSISKSTANFKRSHVEISLKVTANFKTQFCSWALIQGNKFISIHYQVSNPKFTSHFNAKKPTSKHQDSGSTTIADNRDKDIKWWWKISFAKASNHIFFFTPSPSIQTNEAKNLVFKLAF